MLQSHTVLGPVLSISRLNIGAILGSDSSSVRLSVCPSYQYVGAVFSSIFPRHGLLSPSVCPSRSGIAHGCVRLGRARVPKQVGRACVAHTAHGLFSRILPSAAEKSSLVLNRGRGPAVIAATGSRVAQAAQAARATTLQLLERVLPASFT